MRSLYKHIYTSPAVERVFRSAAFGPLLADRPKLEGPFKVRFEWLLSSEPPAGVSNRMLLCISSIVLLCGSTFTP